MPTINVIVIKGNCTAKPELSYTPSGTAVAKFSIGMTEKYKTKAGEQQERASFFNVCVWKKQAESCAEYLTKGQEVVISGRLSFDRWKDKEGQSHSRVYITANTVHFGRLPKAKTQSDENQDPPSPSASAQDNESDSIPSSAEDIPAEDEHFFH